MALTFDLLPKPPLPPNWTSIHTLTVFSPSNKLIQGPSPLSPQAMTPSLPPELLAEILERATERVEPAERQRIRNRFRLVCREWNESLDYWSEVFVGGVQVIARLKAALVEPSAAGFAERIRSVVLDRTGPNSMPEGIDSTEEDLLWDLVACFTSAERIQLSMDGLGGRFGDARGVAPALVRALAQLTNVRHFTLTSPARYKDVVALSCEQLDQYVILPLASQLRNRLTSARHPLPAGLPAPGPGSRASSCTPSAG